MKKQSKFKKLLYSQKVAPYVFVMPFIITFVVFFAYSIVSMIIMSFQKVAGPNTTFVGLENYKILTNAVFIKSLKNSIFYTIVTCLLMIPIPMVLAAMLNSKHMRAKGTFRSILFIPALTSVVVAGVVFRLMFGELDGSFMNQVVGLFGTNCMAKNTGYGLVYNVFPVSVEMDGCKYDVLFIRTSADTSGPV